MEERNRLLSSCWPAVDPRFTSSWSAKPCGFFVLGCWRVYGHLLVCFNPFHARHVRDSDETMSGMLMDSLNAFSWKNIFCEIRWPPAQYPWHLFHNPLAYLFVAKAKLKVFCSRGDEKILFCFKTVALCIACFLPGPFQPKENLKSSLFRRWVLNKTLSPFGFNMQDFNQMRNFSKIRAGKTQKHLCRSGLGPQKQGIETTQDQAGQDADRLVRERHNCRPCPYNYKQQWPWISLREFWWGECSFWTCLACKGFTKTKKQEEKSASGLIDTRRLNCR